MSDNTMSTHHGWGGLEGCRSDTDATSPENARNDIYVQLAISAALGITSFLAFCVSSYLIDTHVALVLQVRGA